MFRKGQLVVLKKDFTPKELITFKTLTRKVRKIERVEISESWGYGKYKSYFLKGEEYPVGDCHLVSLTEAIKLAKEEIEIAKEVLQHYRSYKKREHNGTQN